MLSIQSITQWGVEGKKKGFEERVAGLNSLIKACARVGKIERSGEIDADVLETIFPELTGWLVVNPFTVME